MESKDLLQVNATVMAGLLILLTVQTLSNEIPPLRIQNEWQYTIIKLETEQYALNKTLQTLSNKTSSIINEERLVHHQNQIDEIDSRLIEVSNTLDKMKSTKFEIKDENNKISTIPEELNKKTFTEIIQMYGIVMLVPFIASSMFILVIFLEKQGKTNVIQKGFVYAKIFTLIGFAVILISLIVFNYFIQFG